MFLGALFRVAAVAAFIFVSTAVPAQAELDECVPADLREKTVTFRTEDDVELSGLVFGSGSRGVAIGSYVRQSYCDWLPLAQELADAGHQVLLFDVRLLELDDPRLAESGHRYDLDVQAAARELTQRGATSIVAGGEVPTAAAAVVAAPRIQGLAGLLLVSPALGFGGASRSSFQHAKPVLESLTVPVFIASSDAPMSNGDPSSADGATWLAEASARTKLDIVSGDALGAALVKSDAALRDRMVEFADEVQPRSFLTRWLPPFGGGVVLLVLVIAGVIVFRRRSRRNVVRSEHDRPSAVGGDEAGQAFAARHDDAAPGSAR
jgi:hypothetical protein